MKAAPSGGAALGSKVPVGDAGDHSRARARPQASAHDDLCAWCFEPLGDQAVELNGGIGHPRCAEYVWRALEGPDGLPWRPQRAWSRDDPLIPFLERLGRAAVRQGIDPHALAAAIGRARHG